MSPLFGGKDEGQDDVATMQAEIDRLDALSIDRLAEEVMGKGFGPDGPGGPGRPGTLEDLTSSTFERVGVTEIARRFTPAYSARAVGPDLIRRLGFIVGEGLQALEHAGLIRVLWNGGQPHYMATRRGRAAAEGNDVAAALGRVGAA